MIRKIKTKCSCGKIEEHEIEFSLKDLNKWKFEKNSKGDFICDLIFNKKVLTVNTLFIEVSKKYSDDNNLGRVNSVLNKLKRRKFISTDSGKIIISNK